MDFGFLDHSDTVLKVDDFLPPSCRSSYALDIAKMLLGQPFKTISYPSFGHRPLPTSFLHLLVRTVPRENLRHFLGKLAFSYGREKKEGGGRRNKVAVKFRREKQLVPLRCRLFSSDWFFIGRETVALRSISLDKRCQVWPVVNKG